ncbi:MAG: type II toxin-antitoxin system VapC family toxin [Actinomycetota bacterium]
MRFWDSSALVPLCLAQPQSPSLQGLLRDDPVVVVWWGSPLECRSAFARLEREGLLSGPQTEAPGRILKELEKAWTEVLPTDAVRQQAARLLRIHPLRAGDALQLAAALVWAGSPPEDAAFITLDERLGKAARLEGFQVLPI